MKFKNGIIVFFAAVLLSGCTGSGGTDAKTVSAGETTAASEAAISETVADAAAESAADSPAESETTDPFANLTQNEYDGLNLTADIAPDAKMHPGSMILVTVEITNSGNKTISYVQGSGSFSTPQALSITVNGLQPVMPADHVGPATMDFVVKELNPGETLNYSVRIGAIKPNGNFDLYAFNYYRDDQAYIGDLEADELFEVFPDLEPAAPGSYTGTVSFTYHTLDDVQSPAMFGEATGYIQVPVVFDITE